MKKLQSEEPYKYVVIRGNNSDLVKRLLEKRGQDWKEVSCTNTIFNFKWVPFSKGIHFDFMSSYGQRKMVNHFPGQDQISKKDTLFTNMCNYYETRRKNIFDVVPITFIIDFTQCNANAEMDKFISYFHLLERYKQNTSVTQLNQAIQIHPLHNAKRYSEPTSYNQYETMIAGHNIWLLKPTSFNRGRGVHLFNSIEQLKKLISDYQQGVEVNLQKTNLQDKQCTNDIWNNQLPEDQQLNNFSNLQNVNNVIKTNAFVIQKYIERPLLINKRKFDIRLWVLVAHDCKCYIFKEGYVRTSTQEFALSPDTIDKPFIHLTNNAIQRFNENYGLFEEGNQLSFTQCQELLKKDSINFDFYKCLSTEIEPIIIDSLKSIEQKLNPKTYKFCFEIFGYDFMIDENLKPWLIEVNTNPCLEESSTLLQKLIPRMLDDAFQLTVDIVFPSRKLNSTQKDDKVENNEPQLDLLIGSEPANGANKGPLIVKNKNDIPIISSQTKCSISNAKSQTREQQAFDRNMEKKESKYHCQGYSNQENMWKFLLQIKN